MSAAPASRSGSNPGVVNDAHRAAAVAVHAVAHRGAAGVPEPADGRGAYPGHARKRGRAGRERHQVFDLRTRRRDVHLQARRRARRSLRETGQPDAVRPDDAGGGRRDPPAAGSAPGRDPDPVPRQRKGAAVGARPGRATAHPAHRRRQPESAGPGIPGSSAGRSRHPEGSMKTGRFKAREELERAVRVFRAELLTQREIAAECEVSKRTVQRIVAAVDGGSHRGHDFTILESPARTPPCAGFLRLDADMLKPRDEQRLAEVHPVLAGIVRVVAASVPLMVVEGARSLDRQRELFRLGKSRTMDSRHLPKIPAGAPHLPPVSHAVDLAPLVDLDGDGDRELTWESKHFLPIARAMLAEAAKQKVAIVWGGSWKSFVDMPHFELARSSYP
ncbi:MAG: hypothetical protein C0434_07990 [Xanthomonadaceae bacterium]|nr:hypothetical protein [Xanthomonadaceae bacterium]